MNSKTDLPLVAVLGPTGSGKSDLALAIAACFGGEVVNCDSLQVYRHLDIGTAKLPPEKRAGIPHHLIDIVDPDQLYTAGDYSRAGRQAVGDIAARGKLPVVAGGTGFYFRALLEGLFQGPARDETLRARLAGREQRRAGSLHRLLTRLDPVSAGRIHCRDVNKLIRSLEVCLLGRRPMAELFAAGRDALQGFRHLKIGLNPPRAELFRRLDLRCESMFEAGLIEETQRILALGFAPSSKPLGSHGYRQAVAFIEGRMSGPEALQDTKVSTRRYAKRQWTWFRRESALEWIAGFGDEESTLRAALERTAAFLRNFGGFPLSGPNLFPPVPYISLGCFNPRT